MPPRNVRGFLELEADDVDLKAGETYTIPVTAPRLTAFKGYQFTLEFDRSALSIERIEPGLMDRGNFGWRFANRGLITTSWNWGGAGVPTTLTGEEVLFSLVVQATVNDKFSKFIQVSSRFTEAEAYRADSDDPSSVALTFNQEDTVSAGYKLFQNIPNPVAKETLIGFELPDAEAEVIIKILDAAGRLVQEFRQPGHTGYNSLRLPRSVFRNTSGVYSYVVSAGNWRATKRMVVME
ncbi:MAG: T9SS type A sorting domain-containing protein [Bacteroidota bacterium]